MSPIEFGLVLGSALLHAVWSVSIKGSGDPVSFTLLQSWTAVAGLAAVAPWVPWDAIEPALWMLLAATGLTHALYIYWMSKAYEHGDLSLVYPIARSTPAFLPLVAVPLFGESLHPGGVAGIATVVAGLWLVHAGTGSWSWRSFAQPAARYAYLTLAATVVYSVIDKAAMTGLAERPWPSLLPRAIAFALLLNMAHTLCFTPLVLRARGFGVLRETARLNWGTAAASFAFSFASYALVLRAFETAPASYVVAVRQTSVLFAVLLGTVWLRERPGRPRVLGAAATVVGVVLIARFS